MKEQRGDRESGESPGPAVPGRREVYRRRWLADVALATSGGVCLLVEPSSITLHSIFGLVFAAAVGPHLWYRRVWIRGAVRRLRHRRPLPAVMRWNLSQALLLLALVAAVTWSGIADWLQAGPRLVPHGLSALLLIIIVVRHTWTRRRRMLLRRKPPAGPAGPAGPPDPASQNAQDVEHSLR